MIEGLGVQWAGTLLGLVAFALVPLPILFFYKGAKIREMSEFAPTMPLVSQANDAPSTESDVEKEARSA
jgi:MFS transporter, DHA1 family, multidrug resistance protein